MAWRIGYESRDRAGSYRAFKFDLIDLTEGQVTAALMPLLHRDFNYIICGNKRSTGDLRRVCGVIVFRRATTRQRLIETCGPEFINISSIWADPTYEINEVKSTGDFTESGFVPIGN